MPSRGPDPCGAVGGRPAVGKEVSPLTSPQGPAESPPALDPYDASYFAARYKADAPLNDYVKRVAGALCDRYHPRKTLDVGCGVGMLVRAFAERTEAWGIEGAQAAIAMSPAAARIRQVDLTRDPFPFGDGEFDLVTCLEVAEHVPVMDRWIAEVSRVLRPGGHFFLQTPNPWSIAAKMDPTHVNVRDKWDWERRFRRVGLRPRYRELAAIDRNLPVGHYGSRLPGWVRYGILEWVVVATGTRTLFEKEE